MTTLFPTEPVLPTYADADLSGLSTAELWQLLIRNEDRVPRNLIDECARRGDEFLDLAAAALESERFWTDDQTRGEAWLPVHAAMILGLMSDDRAGVLLAGYMRRIPHNEELQDWLAGYWPAFFRNKSDEQIELMKALGEDASLGWFMRLEAIEVALAMAQARGSAVLNSVPGLGSAFRVRRGRGRAAEGCPRGHAAHFCAAGASGAARGACHRGLLDDVPPRGHRAHLRRRG